MGQDMRSTIEEKDVEGIDRAKWMEQIFTGSNVKIADIMFVGTHNSFAIDSSLPKENHKIKFSMEKAVSKTCYNLWVGKTFVKGLCRSWSQCQSHSITQQLLDGARYLDFRIIRTSGKKFEVCHTISYGKLMPLLKEVKNFVNQHPKELVFLHFQKIYNCNGKQKRSFGKIIWNIFENDLVSPKEFSFNSKLQDIWKENKKIIIFFGDRSSFPEYFWNCSKIRNPWINTSKISELRPAIADELKRGEPCGLMLWVIQAILTPAIQDVVSGIIPLFPETSLSRLTNDLHVRLPKWFKEFARNMSNTDRRPNVILIDFYHWPTLFPFLTRVNIAMSRRLTLEREDDSLSTPQWMFDLVFSPLSEGENSQNVQNEGSQSMKSSLDDNS